MSETYIPLYRKYRPQKLDEVVGQEHIKRALSNAVELGKISHAYLFTGPRGTGKTSTARILAKSLNCINGPTVSPCGKCVSCTDITNTVPIDVIEIDAASNRKVEDAQNILEKIQYVPVNGKYKIYIIDEVHMLTNTAFNALLKTLEEPPENVVFILATTESHKVLDTIKSRCQRFDFRRITTDDIAKHLRSIADKEKIKISDAAIMSIAKNSAGGMRDSIALLDQVSILGESKEIDEEDINNLLGRLSFDTLYEISESIISSDSMSALKLVEKVYSSGNEPVQILNNLMQYFKNLLIVKNCNDDIAIELTNLGTQQLQAMSKQKDNIETHQIVFVIEKIAEYIKEIKNSVSQQMWLEVGIIDVANLTNNTKLVELQARLQALEEGNPVRRERAPIVKPVSSAQNTVKEQEINPVIKATSEKKEEIVKNDSDKDDVTPMPKVQIRDNSNDISTLWATLLSNINSSPTQAILKLAKPVKIAPDEVIITFKQEMFVKRVDGTKKAAIVEAADKMFDQKNSVVIVRTPLESDKDIIVSIPDEPIVKKEKVQSKTLIEEKNESVENEESISEAKEVLNESSVDEGFESDQSKMIKDLFDGKYIN